MTRWAAGAASSVLRRVRSVPCVVWAVTALVGALGIFHSFTTPLAAATDENTHADMIFWLAEGNAYPEFDGRLVSETSAGIVYSLNNTVMFPNTPEKVAAVRNLMVEPFGRLGPDDPRGPEQYNQMAQHPPLYYESAKVLVLVDRKLHGGATGWFGEWHRLRITTFAPMVALPLLAWAATRRMGGSSEAAVTASVFVLAVPQLLHTTSALNNDTYMVVFGAIVAWLLAGVIRDGPRRSVAAAIGLFVGLALLTKAFALVFPPWVAVVYARQARRHREDLGRSVRDLAIAGVVAFAVAGWWWIGNLLRHGTPLPSTEGWLYTSAMQPPGFEPDLGWYLTRFAAWMPRRFFGWFGWFSAPLGLAFVVAASAITAGAVAYAFGRRQQGVSRFDLAALLSVLPMLLVFVFARAWSLYTTTGQTPFIQGRYLFAGFVPLAVIVGIGAARALGRRAALVFMVGAIVMQGAALRVMLRTFWGAPDDSWAERIEALRAWNPGLVDPQWWFVGAVLPLTVLCLVLLVAFARTNGAPASPSDRELTRWDRARSTI